MSILVVDDDDMARSVAVMVLQDGGYEVTEADSAAAAIALLDREPERYSHLFTDVRMPGWQDGVDLAEHVFLEHPHIAVVVTSGYHEHRSDALEQNATFVPKPWTADDLIAAVKARARGGESALEQEPAKAAGGR